MLLITNNSEFAKQRDRRFEKGLLYYSCDLNELRKAYDNGGLMAQDILSKETRVLKRKVKVLFWLLIGALALGMIGFYFYILTIIR